MNAPLTSASPTLELTHKLIARPSVTPDDAGCLELIAARLAPLGFVCERIDGCGVSNLWARRGTARPLVVFAGHTDVVPTGPIADWPRKRTPPITVSPQFSTRTSVPALNLRKSRSVPPRSPP